VLALGDVFLESAIEPSTAALYRSQWQRFVVWCEQLEFDPTAVDDRIVTAFVRYLTVDLRLSRSSVSTALSALHHHYRFAASNPVLSARVKAARRAAGKVAPSAKPKRPITSVLLLRMAEKYCPIARDMSNKKYLIHLRDWALILFAHRSLMRRSELVALRNADVQWTRISANDPEAALWPPVMLECDLMIARIRASKTQPTGRKADPDAESGTTVIVGPHANPDLCPVRWCRRLQLSNFKSIGSGYFFPQVGGKSKHEPLAGASVGHIVKRAVEALGLRPTEFGAHSTRRGAATEAFRRAVDARLIKDAGRWKSDCVYAYIDDVTGNQLEFQRVMGGMAGIPHAPKLSLRSGGGASSSASAAAALSDGSDDELDVSSD
jgi:integrase